MMGGMMGGFGSGFGGFGGLGLIGMILNLAISVALIVGVVLLIAWLWRRVNPGTATLVSAQSTAAALASPKEIAQIRYARGEITRDQYELMKQDLA